MSRSTLSVARNLPHPHSARSTISRRGMAVAVESQTSAPPPRMQSGSTPSFRKQREEGDIGSVFASLAGETDTTLPERFLHLKRQVIGDEANQKALIASWERLTKRLERLVPSIEEKQQDGIPQTSYDEFLSSPKELIDRIKESGTVVVRGVVSEDQANSWLKEIEDYIKTNPEVKGFPADDKQVFELYWSKPQLSARFHPRSLAIQKHLLSLFHAPPTAPVSLSTPLSYADRLRIRHPGDAKFALGPHMDNGSVERWEDGEYRKVYESILNGKWEDFDAYDMNHRAVANINMYDGPGSCGVFRAFQGWTALSNTGPNEGTLRVFPYIREMSAYVLLRPLFKEKQSRSQLGTEEYLSSHNWELDLETSSFPGSPLARGQEMNDQTHPHLQLERSMVSVPRVRPGDQVYWHCDTIHAVESVHRGSGPSAVMYIPSVPLTAKNADYVGYQKQMFLAGKPAPDFPGGKGEEDFEGRAMEGDVKGQEARNAMGLDKFALEGGLTSGEKEVRQQANSHFGF